jgi:hypothetical protein
LFLGVFPIANPENAISLIVEHAFAFPETIDQSALESYSPIVSESRDASVLAGDPNTVLVKPLNILDAILPEGYPTAVLLAIFPIAKIPQLAISVILVTPPMFHIRFPVANKLYPTVRVKAFTKAFFLIIFPPALINFLAFLVKGTAIPFSHLHIAVTLVFLESSLMVRDPGPMLLSLYEIPEINHVSKFLVIKTALAIGQAIFPIAFVQNYPIFVLVNAKAL